MYVRFPPVAIGVLAVLLATACDDGTGPTGSLGDFEPAEAVNVVDGLYAPILGSTSPTSALRDAWQMLTDRGVSFERHAPVPRLLRPSVTGDLVFPTDVLGQTFVYEIATGTWSADSTRTDAPADGVRVIWYQTDAAGNLLQPLAEGGYVDLTDEDAGNVLSRVGIHMVADTDTGEVVLSTLTESLDTTGGQFGEVFQATGFYGGASREVGFDMVSDASSDTVSGAEDLALSIGMSAEGESYALTVTGSVASDTSAVEQNYLGTVSYDGGTTELDLDFTQDPAGTQTGSGTLSHEGTIVARITVEGSDFLYADADGNELSTSDQVAVDNLVRTLFLSGLQAFFTLPLLFL
jgi:hypothetical protein